MPQSGRNSKHKTKAAAGVSRRKKVLNRCVQGVIVVALLALGVFAMQPDWFMGKTELPTTTAGTPAPTAPAEFHTDFELEPTTLDELLSIPIQDLQKVDIARMNLLCASSVPDSKYLTPDGINDALSVIDGWLPRIKSETDRHLYRATDPRYFDEYGGSEAKVRAALLAIVLQQDLGVKYDPAADGNFSFAKSSVAFIHGMIPRQGQTLADTPGGSCASMPVLYVAVGRRLGYPLKLATTDSHIFVRWDGADHPNPSFRGRFNIEATDGVGFPSDDHYRNWPNKLTEHQVRANRFLVSLSPAEEFAQFLAAQGHVGFDNGQFRYASRAYENAYRYDPTRPAYRGWFINAALRCDYQPTTAALASHLAARRQMLLARARSDGDPFNDPPMAHLPWRVAPNQLPGATPARGPSAAGHPIHGPFGQQRPLPQYQHPVHQPHVPAAYRDTPHASGYQTHPNNGG